MQIMHVLAGKKEITSRQVIFTAAGFKKWWKNTFLAHVETARTGVVALVKHDSVAVVLQLPITLLSGKLPAVEATAVGPSIIFAYCQILAVVYKSHL